MKISKKSSLYKLARLGGMSEYKSQYTNLCSVFWHSIWGIFFAACMVIGASLIGALIIVMPVVSIIGYFVTGAWIPNDVAIMGMVIDSICFVLWLIGHATIVIDRKRLSDPDYAVKKAEKDRQRAANPGLLRVAYRGWKEKTCVIIQFADQK